MAIQPKHIYWATDLIEDLSNKTGKEWLVFSDILLETGWQSEIQLHLLLRAMAASGMLESRFREGFAHRTAELKYKHFKGMSVPLVTFSNWFEYRLAVKLTKPPP
jgi:hypothetical protein